MNRMRKYSTLDDDIEMSPKQSNAVIEEKLTHLQPLLEGLHAQMQEMCVELTGEVACVHWKEILERVRD